MKSQSSADMYTITVSLPVRGAWIEIVHRSQSARSCRRSPCGERGLKSFLILAKVAIIYVAPRAGSVD